MDKAEAIERLECLKAKAQLVLEQEVPEWIAEDVLSTIEAYDMAIEALQTEPNSSEKPNNSTVSKMEQVDKDINVRSKDEPKTQMKTQNSNLTFEKADEPQTDCPWK